MNEAELQLQISEHEQVLAKLEARRLQLEAAPAGPPGPTGSALLEYFDRALTQADELEGVVTALAEIRTRTTRLQGQLQQLETAANQRREQERRNQVAQSVLNLVTK